MGYIDYNNLFIVDELPQLLDQIELYDYFEKYKAGDKTAREIIIKHNIRLVISIVINKFAKTPYDEAELIAVGIIGLIKSVDKFDLSKNYQFSSFAFTCIENEIRTFLKKENKYINVDSLDIITETTKNGIEITSKDTLCDDSDFVADYEDKQMYNIVRKIVYSLPKRDKEIIMFYFGFIDNVQLTQEQIADKFGFSQKYISQLIKKALEKLRLKLEAYDIIDIVSDSRKVKRIQAKNKNYITCK